MDKFIICVALITTSNSLISAEGSARNYTGFNYSELAKLANIQPFGSLLNTNFSTTHKSGYVAVCFFGQVKKFEQVSASVKFHIFDVLSVNGYGYDVYAHTFNQSTFDNPRNSEYSVRIDPFSLQNLLSIPEFAVRYNRVREADSWMDIDFIAKNGDPWPKHNLLTLRYYIRQLFSLKRVTMLWLPSRAKYDFVLYLRPDVLFLTDLDLPKIGPRLDDATLVTPSFACWENLWNDRMAYGKPAVMARYGLRGDHLAEYVTAGKQPHAETFLGDHMISLNVTNVLSDTVFQRMRADGRIDRRDFLLANAKPRPGRC